jgi:hypothetical protein
MIRISSMYNLGLCLLILCIPLVSIVSEITFQLTLFSEIKLESRL